MRTLRHILFEREALFTIGIFGIAQMAADLVADLGVNRLSLAIRSFGIVLVLVVLFLDHRRKTTLLPVPLLFVEESSREKAHAKFEHFVREMHLSKAVKEIDALSPVQPSELYIRLSADVRVSQDAKAWEDALQQMLYEWEKEVDARLRRWLPGVHSGVVYHIRPNVVLPLAFALGNAVGLRRSIVLYHAEPSGEPYRVMDLSNPRVLFEPPQQQIPLQQIPDDISPPPQGGDRLILHLVVSDRHPPALYAHPDYQQATNVAIYLNQQLPQADWLLYAQAIWAKAAPWVSAVQQVDVCLVGTDALVFALGMAFSRTPHLRVCHWFNGQYLPVLDLSSIAARPPFD